ncbi:MAG: hypothetical protein HC892_18075 [Saprospiraceae bacterium]|nr:hypothetical protein [Saprospiraceae bacterium]
MDGNTDYKQVSAVVVWHHFFAAFLWKKTLRMEEFTPKEVAISARENRMDDEKVRKNATRFEALASLKSGRI